MYREQKSQGGGGVFVALLVCVGLWYLINNPGVLRSAVASVRSMPVQSSSVQLSSSSSSYRDLARQDAQAAGIPADLFINQINQESGFDPNARGAAGEIGMCQFLPSTAAGLGVNPADPASCLKGMADMMGRYYRQYGGYDYALAGYNCGGGCLASAVKWGDAWYLHIPRGSRSYICAIMGRYC